MSRGAAYRWGMCRWPWTPTTTCCGNPLQKWWDLHPLIYVPRVGSKQGNTISLRHPSPSGTSLMWGPFSDPHLTANPPSLEEL